MVSLVDRLIVLVSPVPVGSGDPLLIVVASSMV